MFNFDWCPVSVKLTSRVQRQRCLNDYQQELSFIKILYFVSSILVPRKVINNS